jgi:hypothetical protein
MLGGGDAGRRFCRGYVLLDPPMYETCKGILFLLLFLAIGRPFICFDPIGVSC